MNYKLCLAMALFAFVCITGCDTGMAKVSGTVSLDGKPLETGVVTFHPAKQQGSIAIGSIEAGGKYVLSLGTEKGIPPGEYLVTVVATEQLPSQPGVESGYREITPAKYANTATSGWKFEVKAGTQTIPLKMKSQP